ncbi:MAG: hypothetical protein DRN90_03810 [Thermoproteota archaeon]|nr:MAG: hypothetical protein DRN90_03810 [Candidatus Korarchaeota archaeon]
MILAQLGVEMSKTDKQHKDLDGFTSGEEIEAMDKRNVAGLFFARFLRSCSMNLQRPVLPTFASSLGADSEKMGMIQSISSLVALPSSLFLGRVADRVGRKIMFTASMVLTFLSRTMYALSTSWVHFIPASIIGSISFRTYRPLSTTIGAESTVKESRALVMSLLSLGWTIPGFFLPYFAGVLAESIGERAVIWISAGAAAIGIIIAWAIIRETYRFKSEPLEPISSLRELLKPNKDLKDIYLLKSIDSISYGIWMRGVLFMFMVDAFQVTSSYLGALSSLRNALSAAMGPISGWASDKIGRKELLVVSEAFGVLTLIALIMFPDPKAIRIYYPILVSGIIATWSSPYSALLAERTSMKNRVTEMSKIDFLSSLIGLPFPFLGGFLFRRFGWRAPFLLALPLTFSSLIAACMVREPT